MNVKSAFTIIKRLNISYLCFTTACVLVTISVYVIQVPNRKLLDDQVHLAVRGIGDELLKSNADFSTPVLPVERIGSETLRLKFNIPIVISPDTLVKLSVRYLNSEIARRSIVNVRDVNTEEIVYGFEISYLEEKNIPCLGRTLPKSNYLVEVSLYNDQKTVLLYSNFPAISTAGASVLLVLFGFSLRRRKTSEVNQNRVVKWNAIKLDIDLNRITSDHIQIQLTDKETQILFILFENKGNLVPRELFIQEVWLRKGVVTDRSLDMFISRLRKKMDVLPNIQIANQHGKGYYLKRL